jgi:hypothetical protein
MSRQITDAEWHGLLDRIAALEKRVADFDQRTAGMIQLGPSPRGPREEALSALRKEAMDLRSRIVKQEKPFPAHETPAVPEAMPESMQKDRPPTSLTDDPSDPRIRRGGPDTEPVPQAEVYLVLSEEERAKGFVRPYRDAYKHVGLRPIYPTRNLTAEEQERHGHYGYVCFEPYPESESPRTGRFWTQAQLDAKGCGSITTMGRALSETYARDPHFYGATYCVTCQKHRPVEEFVWTADGARLGT